MKKLTAIIILFFIIAFAENSANAQWNLAGNAGTNPLTNYVGTSDAQSFVMRTNATEAMRITAGQLFGIGTSAPAYKIHVVNSTNSRSISLDNSSNLTSTKYGVYNTVNNTGIGGRYGIYNSSASNAESNATNYGIYNTVSHPGTGTAYGVYSSVSTQGTGTHYGIYSTSSGSSNYSFYGIGRGYFSDNVGLGITNPSAPLHIKDVEVDLTSGGSMIIGPVSGVNMAFDANEIHVRDNGAAAALYLNPKGKPVVINNSGVLEDLTLSTDGAFRIGSTDANNLAFDGNEIQARSSGVASVLKLNELGGNVCIGTASGTEKLNVCGGIKATEIRVESGWCDYVFDQKYNLRPLSEVAEYISENKHLPNIPAAVEVENSGLALGEMSRRMMEKIEELTLYMIQQDQQIRVLQSDNTSMKQQLQEIASH